MNENVIAFFRNWRKKTKCIYLIENATAHHIKWTFAGFVKIECDLSVNTHAKVIIHVQFTMWQPIHVQTTCCMTFNVNQPAI